MDDFRGKVAVVTGGGSGIGRALACMWAREGARVVLADVDEAGMAETAAAIARAGGQALAVRTDVSRREDVLALAERTFAECGAAHVLCNNAGVAASGPLHEASHADWQWLIGVNLWGVIHGIGAFVPRMVAARAGGHVVNTASMAGLIASERLGVYNTTKYAVVGLSETLQKDLRPHGIGVSVLCPMGVDTRILESDRSRPAELRNATPTRAEGVALIGGRLTPEQVAEMVLKAVRRNQLYVITHPEGREPLRRRFARMDRAIEELHR